MPKKSILERFTFELIQINSKGKIISCRKKEAEYFREALGGRVTLDLVSIPSGTFIMGSGLEEARERDLPQHPVAISSYFMSKFPRMVITSFVASAEVLGTVILIFVILPTATTIDAVAHSMPSVFELP